MKPAIFRDKDSQAKFDRDGYFIFDFISPEDISLIAKKFYELHPDLPQGFFSEAFNPDELIKQNIFDHTEKLFQQAVNEKFENFRKLGSTFLCKSPGEKGKMPVHQDWTVVDESKYYSATIWVPTVDTTTENGALRILPGSHLFFNAIRSNNLDFCYQNHVDLLWDNMITIPMKVGQAVLLNHAVIHASAPNNTSKERLAIAYGLIPAEAQLLYYHKESGEAEGSIEKFHMPDDFFQKYYNVGQRPLLGDVVERFKYQVSQVNALEINNLINIEKRKRTTQPLFNNKDTQESFEKNGFVKIPALKEDDVKQLLDFYYSVALKDEAGFGFHISMDQQDKSLVKTILDKLFEIALPRLEPHLNNAKPFVGSFVIKEPNPKSVVPVHQDWTFVEDEDLHCSVTCWIPLVDVDIDNGAMGLIKGSHNYFDIYRPSPSPQVPSPISEHMFSIFPYLQLIEMKAGEALIFDNRTFHGSPPNTTDKPRIAFGIGFTSREANLVHYYLKPDGNKDTVQKYQIDPAFFLKYENSILSKMYDSKEQIRGYEMVSQVPYILPKFTQDELISLVKSTGNDFNVPMCEKLAKLFNYNMDGSAKEKAIDDDQINIGEQQVKVEEAAPYVWIDNRSFIEKYTPLNIAREVKKRLFSLS